MDPFEMPEVLPATSEELTGLREACAAELRAISAAGEADESSVDPARVDELLGFLDTLNEAITAQSSRADALDRARAATAEPEPEPEPEVVAEIIEDDPAPEPEPDPEPTRELVTVTAGTGSRRKIDFSGAARRDEPDAGSGPGWQVVPGAPGFKPEQVGTRVGFAEMGKALDTVTRGHGVGKLTGRLSGQKMRQPIGLLTRDLEEATDQFSLVAKINEATSTIPGYGKVTTEALTAAGGWCAPSEQIYTFCDIPEASDLISLPDIAITRGGLRWPVEPDLTSLFDSFEFYFTEAQLEAVDGNDDPTAIKHCVEIPCPEDFEELRLNAVGYCVEAGILQRQGWPESIEYVLRALAQEHLRAMSRRTILDMWNGSGAPKVFDAALQVGGTSSVLNSLDLMAHNLRLSKGYSSTYPMEIVAPSWFFAALRADLAMMEGTATKSVTDAEIRGWLSARNIAGQFVGDWQTRDVSQPGHLDTVRWPGHVDVIMYPAGTWFRALSNIIEVGVLYPKEQLQVNRYTEMFTEDAIAVGKRCDRSVNLRIPLCINGGYGAPVEITCTDTATDLGTGISGAPIPSGQSDASATATKTITATGTVSGGTFKLTVQGEETATIAYNATAANIKTAIVALDNAYAELVTTGGGPLPGTPATITVPAGWGISLTSSAVTGGGSVALA